MVAGFTWLNCTFVPELARNAVPLMSRVFAGKFVAGSTVTVAAWLIDPFGTISVKSPLRKGKVPPLIGMNWETIVSSPPSPAQPARASDKRSEKIRKNLR
jgi:hypothetical protein